VLASDTATVFQNASTTHMPRKGETARFKGAKSEPTRAVKKERERKRDRDRKDNSICEKLGCRGRLNSTRPECSICLEDNATHKVLPCGHNYCMPHAQYCMDRHLCAICQQVPHHVQALFNLATCSPEERDFLAQ
jgi:hypothetical protein